MHAKHIILCGTMLLMVVVLSGCSGGDPEYDQIERVLYDGYAKEYQEECSINIIHFSMLYGKPEFEQLRDREICRIDIDIRNVTYLPDDTVRVEYRILQHAERRTIREFLRAWNRMEERLKRIPPQRLPDPDYGATWVYFDPYDNLMFVADPAQPEGIEHTKHWERLQDVKQIVVDLSDKRRVESPVFIATVRRMGERWEWIHQH
jgi:hypothetical protein